MAVNIHCNTQQLLYLKQFILFNNLQPGDVIIVKEKGKGIFRDLIDHYIIYLGGDAFMANYTEGTRILTCPVIFKFLPSMTVSRIRRFKGNWYDRQIAVQRALAHKDRRSYHLIVENCEHFANHVQFGKSSSDQVLIGGTSATLVGLGLMATKSPFLQITGGILVALGSITAGLEIAKRTV